MANYETLKQLKHAQPTMYSDRYDTVQDSHGNLVYRQNGYFSVSDRKVVSQQQAQTQVPSSLSNSLVDFKIDNKLVDVLDMLDLQIDLVNNSGAASVYKASPLLLNRYEVISGQGTIVFNSEGQEIYMSNFFLDKNSYEGLASVQDLNATTYASAGTSTANTATLRLNILLHGMFKACKIPLCALDSPLTIRFYFNPSSLFVTTGSEMTCTGLSLIAHGRRLSQQARNEIIGLFHNFRIPISLSHLSVDRMTITQNLSSGTTINIPLTGIRGIAAFMIFTIRLASTANTSAPITYLRADSFDVLDGSGSSLIGHLARNANLQRIHWTQCFSNDACNTCINFVSFAMEPRLAFATGSNSGYCVFTGGNETLRINLGSNITTASHVIDIRVYCYESIHFDTHNGVKALRD